MSLRQAAQAVLDAWDGKPVPSASSLMDNLRTALAEKDECKWIYSDEGECWESSCEFAMAERWENADTYMRYCYGCGKKIRFVDE